MRSHPNNPSPQRAFESGRLRSPEWTFRVENATRDATHQTTRGTKITPDAPPFPFFATPCTVAALRGAVNGVFALTDLRAFVTEARPGFFTEFAAGSFFAAGGEAAGGDGVQGAVRRGEMRSERSAANR